MKQVLFILFTLGLSPALWAQTDSINVLEQVILTDAKLTDFSTGQTLVTLSDSLLLQQKPSLTSVLNYNTPIYFKENGLGMVSSPSFRGTTAQQTAVLWNGININSNFNGQTDFNTINAANYDQISVRAGGGSVVYGTGAIGGTVHLNNTLSFHPHFDNRLYMSYGSFNTWDGRYKLSASTGNWSTQISMTRNQSDNDYDYPKNGRKNENGQFYNNGINAALAYRFNQNNMLSLYSETYESERHFSLTRPSENKSKYEDFTSRNLLEYVSEFGAFTSVAKVAFLKEGYHYYGNIERDEFAWATAETYIGKYDFTYAIADNIEANAVLSHELTQGEGSDVTPKDRSVSSAAVLWKHTPFERFQYELAFRKEVTPDYNSPFLYSGGVNYQVSDFYVLKANVSKNFRIPTFNDLYWETSGNSNLKAEEADQYELGNQFSYGNWQLTLTGYYNSINNMIRWLPQSDGFWTPENVDKAETYGGEALLYGQKKWGKQVLEVNATYGYTVSKNKATGNQMIYVPFHKANASIYYQIGKWFADYQALFNGEVYTRTDNNPVYNMDSYWISNLGVGYHFSKQLSLGGKVHNIFNEEYQSFENRWMPGINFNLYLTLTI